MASTGHASWPVSGEAKVDVKWISEMSRMSALYDHGVKGAQNPQ